jgi:PTS system beta-glucosides-specific IIC component
MVIGAMLIYPTFVDGVSAGTEFTLFGLPVYGASYTSTIFPVILCVWVMAPIEKFFAKISPDSLRSIIEPLCTLIVMIPLSFCLLAPAGAFLGNYVSAFVIWLYNTIGFIGVAVLAAFMPFLIMTGMHSAFVPYLLQMFGSVGYEPIFFTALVISNIDQGASALAVAVKTKDKNIRSTSLSCAVTAIVAGVTEPAMYGVNLKYKKPMWGAMIGSAIAGLFAGLMKVYIYAFAGASSIVAIPCFIGPESSNVIMMCVAIVIGIVATFIATLILYKDEKKEA